MIGLLLVSAALASWFTEPTSNAPCSKVEAFDGEATWDKTGVLKISLKTTGADATESSNIVLKKGENVIGAYATGATDIKTTATEVSIPLTTINNVGDGTGLTLEIQQGGVGSWAACGDPKTIDAPVTTAVPVLSITDAGVITSVLTLTKNLTATDGMSTLKCIDGTNTLDVAVSGVTGSAGVFTVTIPFATLDAVLGKTMMLKDTAGATELLFYVPAPVASDVKGYTLGDATQYTVATTATGTDKVYLLASGAATVLNGTAPNFKTLKANAATAQYYFKSATAATPFAAAGIQKVAALAAGPAVTGYAHYSATHAKLSIATVTPGTDAVARIAGTAIAAVTNDAALAYTIPLADLAAAASFVHVVDTTDFIFKALPTDDIALLPAAPSITVVKGAADPWTPLVEFKYADPHTLKATNDLAKLVVEETPTEVDVQFASGTVSLALNKLVSSEPTKAYFYHETGGKLVSIPVAVPAIQLGMSKTEPSNNEIEVTATVTKAGTYKVTPAGIVCHYDGEADMKKGKYYAFTFTEAAPLVWKAKAKTTDFTDTTKAVKCFVTKACADPIADATLEPLSTPLEIIAKAGGSAGFSAAVSTFAVLAALFFALF